ncbi:type IV secretory system conjugative DNA transfer family protein [Thermotalea metallivorans]|uniref:TraD/TraG TraM recognition site domain-containing protein n=1 Tax=Thermotalea metallivorans TaxID=520762 RepID=A0A140L855_9FIRM|nr:type IV secretory system conjugative DNA transfer family protein [Thermotalea metallivorans]KXG76730.1 hypothetical protein AN619_08800 [Thermotalea metallivorans]
MGQLVLGKSTTKGEYVTVPEIDRFGHMLIVGPNGSGKTSKIIKPCIWQDLLDIKRKKKRYEDFIKKETEKANRAIEAIKARNISLEEKLEKIQKILDAKEKSIKEINPQEYKAGLSIIEPKGDLCEDVVKMCQTLDLPYIYIDPLNPNTHKLNIMQGDPDIIAESNRTVLRNLFGKQEAFFAQVQETTARNTILLLKKILGDKIDIIDVIRALRSESHMMSYLNAYRNRYGDDDLVEYFTTEVFGTLKDKFYQFALGLRQQLEDIGQNRYLQRVLIGNSDIDLDKHLEEGGILIVNTAMGTLGKLGDVFGQFVMNHLQNAVFRRPGNEKTRPYHYLWVDEAPRYINPDLERLLAIGRSYRCSTNLAVQTTAQLQLETNRLFDQVVLTNCKTKIIFGGLPADEAKIFEKEFGADKKNIKQYTYQYNQVVPMPALLPKSYRASEKEENRYTYTEIMELQSWQKEAEALVKYTAYGAIQPPEKIITSLGDYSKLPDEFIEDEKKVQKLEKIKKAKKEVIEKAETWLQKLIKKQELQLGDHPTKEQSNDKLPETVFTVEQLVKPEQPIKFVKVAGSEQPKEEKQVETPVETSSLTKNIEIEKEEERIESPYVFISKKQSKEQNKVKEEEKAIENSQNLKNPESQEDKKDETKNQTQAGECLDEKPSKTSVHPAANSPSPAPPKKTETEEDSEWFG